MTFELLVISLLVLLLVLMVLLVLCWILRHSRNKNLTELRISAGRPARVLTIRTEPDKAQEMLDHLLDRVFLLVESGPQSGEELEEERVAEPGEYLGGERGSDSGSNPEVSTAGCLPRSSKALDKLWKWMTAVVPPAATPPPHSPPPPPPPPPPSPPPSPASQDETEDHDPQWSDAWGEEEKHYELQV